MDSFKQNELMGGSQEFELILKDGINRNYMDFELLGNQRLQQTQFFVQCERNRLEIIQEEKQESLFSSPKFKDQDILNILEKFDIQYQIAIKVQINYISDLNINMDYSHWIKKAIKNKYKLSKVSSESSTITKKHISKYSRMSMRELYKSQKWEELIKIAKETKGLFEEYDCIKVQNKIIKLGENVLINSGDAHNEDYVGTIKQIISIKEPTTLKLICLCCVQWYMRKSEVIKSHPKSDEWISEQELFKTKHEDYILAQTVIDSCQIFTCKEYVDLDEIESTFYFNRLSWDMEKKQFQGFEKLQKFCSCQQPVNPDRKYVQCDNCHQWYHPECMDLKEGDINDCDFYCKFCL